MQLRLLEIFARDGLLSSKAGEPSFEWLKRFQERIHFAQLTAFRRVLPIENSQGCLLLANRLLWQHIHKIQSPAASDLVAKFVGFREVVASLQKEHRNVWQP